jgi:hypothetical protein
MGDIVCCMDFMGFREEIVARIWVLWRIFSASFSACLRAMCELVSRCIRCLPPICGKRFLRRLMSDVFVPAFQLSFRAAPLGISRLHMITAWSFPLPLCSISLFPFHPDCTLNLSHHCRYGKFNRPGEDMSMKSQGSFPMLRVVEN